MDGEGRAVGPEPPDDEGDVAAGVWCESGSARAAMADIIRSAAHQLEAELPGARDGAPEAVHQARVATRRLRSDLRTFASLLDPDWTAAVRGELEWLGDALGAVRDTDVLAMRLDEALRALGIVDVVGLRGMLERQAVAARAGLIEAIDDPRSTSLLARLRLAGDDPPTTLAAVGRADRRMRPLVRRPWKQLCRAVDQLDDHPRMDELHRVRLLAKRCRYGAEAVVPVFGRDARRFAAAARDLQDHLGEMNDAAVAAEWLGRLAEHLDPVDAFTAGRLAHHFGDLAAARSEGWERSFDRCQERSRWLR